MAYCLCSREPRTHHYDLHCSIWGCWFLDGNVRESSPSRTPTVSDGVRSTAQLRQQIGQRDLGCSPSPRRVAHRIPRYPPRTPPKSLPQPHRRMNNTHHGSYCLCPTRRCTCQKSYSLALTQIDPGRNGTQLRYAHDRDESAQPLALPCHAGVGEGPF